MLFDLANLNTTSACDKAEEIELKHPVTNVPLGMFLSVIGKDSKEFREHTRRRINERLRRDAMATKRGKDPEVRTIESIEDENIELLVLCTKGWRGMIMNGDDLPFTRENLIKVFKEYTWIYDQANENIGALDNFLK